MKTLYYTATSLDGYIADPNHSLGLTVSVPNGRSLLSGEASCEAFPVDSGFSRDSISLVRLPYYALGVQPGIDGKSH